MPDFANQTLIYWCNSITLFAFATQTVVATKTLIWDFNLITYLLLIIMQLVLLKTLTFVATLSLICFCHSNSCFHSNTYLLMQINHWSAFATQTVVATQILICYNNLITYLFLLLKQLLSFINLSVVALHICFYNSNSCCQLNTHLSL